jgi:hypothetical protein
MWQRNVLLFRSPTTKRAVTPVLTVPGPAPVTSIAEGFARMVARDAYFWVRSNSGNRGNPTSTPTEDMSARVMHSTASTEMRARLVFFK